MRQNPRPNEIYRHFKGNCYQVLTIALHSETMEQLVVYQQLYAPFGVYVRPLDMFMSEVDHAKYPEVTQTYRFEKIQEPAWEDCNQIISKQVTENQTNVDKSERREEQLYTEKTEQNAQVSEKTQKDITEEKQTYAENAETESELQLDPGLLHFLEADTYEEKLEILSSMHNYITDHMIDTMAVSMDVEVKEGETEQRYSELMNCLLKLEHFECNRLR